MKFLESECSQTPRESDFILVSELQRKYKTFCRESKIDESTTVDIVGSTELENFGAKLKENFTVPYIAGVAEKIGRPKKKQIYEVSGLTKAVKKQRENNKRCESVRSFYENVKNILWSEQGVITNWAIVLLYLILVFSIPILIYIAFIWSFLQINIIRDDIYAPIYSLNDVFNSSSYDFWLDSPDIQYVFYIFGATTVLFIITGLLELICFFATEEKDVGKYEVKKTLSRAIISNAFWLMLLFYIAVYIFYFGIVIVWSILGAVLNPEKFLPTASGALVIAGAAFLLYTRLKNADKTLTELVLSVVNEHLKTAMFETIQKQNSEMTKLLHKVDEMPEILFNKALNA
jgi:hypothetical protein